MHPAADDLWFLPLGGTGEIGMNLNLYSHAGRWLMVDCGVTFAKEGQPSIDRIKHLFAGRCPLLADADTCVQHSLPRTDRR